MAGDFRVRAHGTLAAAAHAAQKRALRRHAMKCLRMVQLGANFRDATVKRGTAKRPVAEAALLGEEMAAELK